MLCSLTQQPTFEGEWVSDVDTAWQILSLINPLGYFTYTINRIKSKIQPSIFLITQFKPPCCWQSQVHVPKGYFREGRALWINQRCCGPETADDCSVWLYESIWNQRCNNVVFMSLLRVQLRANHRKVNKTTKNTQFSLFYSDSLVSG